MPDNRGSEAMLLERRKMLSLWLPVSMAAILSMGCEAKERNMEKFAWRPTESAHRAYPIFILQAVFSCLDGTVVEVPAHRNVNNGWGELGASVISGEDEKTLPTHLEAAWFSYVEDKFYAGSWDLPTRRLRDLFSQPLPPDRTGTPGRFSRLIIGFGLEGHLSLWTSGSGATVEVAAWRAPTTDIDWRMVVDNPKVSRRDYIDLVLNGRTTEEDRDRLVRKGLPTGLFEFYRRRYAWSPRTDGPVTPLKAFIRYANGELETIPQVVNTGELTRERPVPLSMTVEWKHDEFRYKARVQLDEGEALAAFAHMADISQGQKMYMSMEAGELGRTLTLSLVGPHSRYALKRVQTEISRRAF